MQRRCQKTLSSLICLVLVGPLMLGPGALRADPPREQIGTVLGNPVFRDQIQGDASRLSSELHRLFTAPVMDKYRQAHREQITPTEQELQFATHGILRSLREQLAGEYGDELRKRLQSIEEQLDGELSAHKRQSLESQKQSLQQSLQPTEKQAAFTAAWLLKHWKLQRFLYDQYGGGRILWQQAGVEAFDAMHRWLQERENAGDFFISDPELRREFYEYWTNDDRHGAFLTDDPQRIHASFLEPAWLQRHEKEPDQDER